MPAIDRYATLAVPFDGPGIDAIPVTPSDGTDLSYVSRALWLPLTGTAGTVRVTTAAGTLRDIPLAAGDMLPLRVTRVWATGTTAAGLWILT